MTPKSVINAKGRPRLGLLAGRRESEAGRVSRAWTRMLDELEANHLVSKRRPPQATPSDKTDS
jgi:hypothetical protein